MTHTDADLLKLADDLEWLALASNKDFALHNGRGKMTKASIAIRQAASQGSAGGERFEVQTGELNELDRAIGIFGRATTETHLDPSDRYDAVKHVRDYLFGLRERLLHSAQASPERLSAEEMRTLEILANCMGFGRTVSALNHALEILRDSQVTSAHYHTPGDQS